MGCPCVNDDQKIDVDDQKGNSSSPHEEYWILENYFTTAQQIKDT